MQQLANKWNVELYKDKHAFVYDYGKTLIALLSPQPNERILDLGCGSGELTSMIAEKAAEVIGMDKSPEMIAKARAQFPIMKFVVGDACDFNFDTPFDAIFSNAALHWVVDYESAITNMYENLKRGGRIVVEFGGRNNVAIIRTVLRQTLLEFGFETRARKELWYFPSIGAYTSALEAKGFHVTLAEWYERPTELVDQEAGIIDWLRMFCGPFLEGLTDNEMNSILKKVQNRVKRQLFVNGKWFADYKRIRVIAYK